MARILGLGDNCIDIYVDQDIQFPGGNALNVSVFCKHLGADAAYLGCIGRDVLGDLIQNALNKEGIDTSHLRVGGTDTPWSRVRHIDGDRFFDGSLLPNPQAYNLQPADFKYIAEFDLVHSSVYSKLDNSLAEIARAAQYLSFDFSDKHTPEYLASTAPHANLAILSAADASDAEVQNLCKSVAEQGPQTVIVTRGSRGAVCFHTGEFYAQPIVETTTVDTLGAGDGFIAGFLVAKLSGDDIRTSLRKAAENASRICSLRGAFGRGSPLIPNQPGIAGISDAPAQAAAEP